MIDISILEENYSRMDDQQLVNLVIAEGQELTPEALELLKKEFMKRKLDINIYNSIGETKVLQQQQNIQHAKDSASTEFARSLWMLAFDSKKEGKTDQEIINALVEKGLDDAHASLIIKSLEPKAKELVKMYDNEMLIGGLVCAVGTAITVWTLTAAQNGGYYVVAWGAIIFGAIRFIKGAANKEKYKLILSNIAAEEGS